MIMKSFALNVMMRCFFGRLVVEAEVQMSRHGEGGVGYPNKVRQKTTVIEECISSRMGVMGVWLQVYKYG